MCTLTDSSDSTKFCSCSFHFVNSVLLLIALSKDCLGATTGGRPGGLIAPPTGTNTQENKNSRSNVMHNAFRNAGKVAGLEIWRVEVNFFLSNKNNPFFPTISRYF